MDDFDKDLAIDTKKAQFGLLLHGIIGCYNKQKTNSKKLPNKEEDIRDDLVDNYLNEPQYREMYDLDNFIFDVESKNMGRVEAYIDIKIMTPETFKAPKKNFYVIECKRLDGNKTLNRKYINEGIVRFINATYSSHHGVNGMIGFMVKSFNIPQNFKKIDDLICKESGCKVTLANTIKFASNVFAVEQTTGLHISKHRIDTNQSNSPTNTSNVDLYHLMFDYSLIIASKPKSVASKPKGKKVKKTI